MQPCLYIYLLFCTEGICSRRKKRLHQLEPRLLFSSFSGLDLCVVILVILFFEHQCNCYAITKLAWKLHSHDPVDDDDMIICSLVYVFNKIDVSQFTDIM